MCACCLGAKGKGLRCPPPRLTDGETDYCADPPAATETQTHSGPLGATTLSCCEVRVCGQWSEVVTFIHQLVLVDVGKDQLVHGSNAFGVY